MVAFDTLTEAQTFMQDTVDIPVLARREDIGRGLNLRAFPLELEGGGFTNVYDLSFREGAVTPTIHAHTELKSIYELAKHERRPMAVTGGGFFYLADVGSATPRQPSLNLAVSNHLVRSLPVVDREAIVCQDQHLSAQHVASLGMLSLNGYELSWSGSLTAHDTDIKVFGNGNVVITHQYSEATGSARVLDEASRFTPLIEEDEVIDVGFIAREDGLFISKEIGKGGVDIFAHDMVLRCHERHLVGDQAMRLLTVGGMAIGGSLQGALSVGPMLTPQAFEAHPINKDMSLGSKPPFVERPLARTAMYASADGSVHIRLFDGRPGSGVFPGVTPSEVLANVTEDDDIVWGCFLDPGQTAKLCVYRGDDRIESFGNRHYLKWAAAPGEKYAWVPDIGRPTGSAIALQ